MFRWFIKTDKDSISEHKPIAISAIPDHPQSFGCKVSWYAVKSTDPAAVVKAFKLRNPRPANWETGLTSAYNYRNNSHNLAFVTPPLDGWIFIISDQHEFPDFQRPATAVKDMVDITRRFSAFPEIQFFLSYRISDAYAWEWIIQGECKRAFYYHQGEVYCNAGRQTSFERELNFFDISGMNCQEAADAFLVYDEAHEEDDRESLKITGISEDDILSIAARISLDPCYIEHNYHTPSVGIIGEMPAQFPYRQPYQSERDFWSLR